MAEEEVKAGMEKILDFFVRMIVGTIAIWFINLLLEGIGICGVVGVNGISVLTCGFLGFPGLVALYAFGIYKAL